MTDIQDSQQYDLELMKIHQMDCLEGLKKIEHNSVDMVLSDPPYFLPINSYVGIRGKGYCRRTLADTSILKGYFERIFEELDRVLKPQGVYYIFCDAQSYPIFYQVMFPYCKYVRLLIWDKMISYNGYTWRHQHECIAWGEKEDTLRINTGDGDIIRCRGVLQKDRNHPAEKPVEILKRLILKHKQTAEMLVLDPYMGSGSVAVASKQCGVKFIGFELDKNYCETANRRANETICEQGVQTIIT